MRRGGISKFFGPVVVSALTLSAGSAVQAEASKMQVTPADSFVYWVGKKVTGQHNGTVKVKSGQVELTDGKVTGGSFEVDMSSIVVEDIKDPAYNKKLSDHLRSSDFFSVTSFPVVKFTITAAKAIEGAAAGQPNYEVEGRLAIKGIEQSVKFPAQITVGKDSSSAKASFNIDRTLFDIRYGSGKFFEGLGDKLIYDEFSVELDVNAKA